MDIKHKISDIIGCQKPWFIDKQRDECNRKIATNMYKGIKFLTFCTKTLVVWQWDYVFAWSCLINKRQRAASGMSGKGLIGWQLFAPETDSAEHNRITEKEYQSIVKQGMFKAQHHIVSLCLFSGSFAHISFGYIKITQQRKVLATSFYKGFLREITDSK